MRKTDPYPKWLHPVGALGATSIILLTSACGTNHIDANSQEGISTCENNGEIKFDPHEKGRDEVVEKASELKSEVAEQITQLMKRVTVGGEQNYTDGDELFSKTADGNYGVRAEDSSLILTFPTSAFQKDTEVIFTFDKDKALPIETGVIMCAGDNGNLYPNGVVGMIDELMDKTSGLDAAID
jgi:hypothetical protein